MKKLFLLSFCSVLSACSTQQDVFKGRERMPVQSRHFLMGQTQKAVKTALGNPHVQRTEEPYCLWIYNQDNCSVLVYFNGKKRVDYAEARGECKRLTALYRLPEKERKG